MNIKHLSKILQISIHIQALINWGEDQLDTLPYINEVLHWPRINMTNIVN